MAPLAARLAPTSLSTLLMIIDLMEEPVTSTPDKKESRGIPEIEVKAPSPKKRSEPLPQGRYLPPMAPLAAQLAPPSHLTSTSLSTLPMIIDLMEELVTSTPNKKESRENQAEMSDGTPKL
jgi:hypothetical protein